MHDLDHQIREYFDSAVTPVEIGELTSVPLVAASRRRSGWIVVAAAALAAVLVVAVPILLSRSDDAIVADGVTTTTSPVVSTTTAPATTAPPATTSPATVTTPPALVELDLPFATDEEKAYAVIRSLDGLIELERAHVANTGAFGTGADAFREYTVDLEFFETADAAATSVTDSVANAPGPEELLQDPGGFPAPIQFDVAIPDGVEVARAVTQYAQQCGRGCRPPELTTGIALRIDRVVVELETRVGDPFEEVLIQQEAMAVLADETARKVIRALDGEAPTVLTVPLGRPLDSFAFSFSQAQDETEPYNVETYGATGVAVGDTVVCEFSGHFSPDRGIPGDAGFLGVEYSGRLEFLRGRDGGTTVAFSQEASDEFWASVDRDSWWRELGVDESVFEGLGALPDDVLSWAGMSVAEDGTLSGTFEPELWEMLELAGDPPGWVEGAVRPYEVGLADLCEARSPWIDDGTAAAIEGRDGAWVYRNGRDTITLDLDRDAAVAAGFLAADDPVDIGDFVVVVDAFEPLVHSVRIDVFGPDTALAGFVGLNQEPDGSFTYATLRWGFGGFDRVTEADLDRVGDLVPLVG